MAEPAVTTTASTAAAADANTVELLQLQLLFNTTHNTSMFFDECVCAPIRTVNSAQSTFFPPTTSASVEGAKDKMRSLMAAQGVADAEKALPPQIFNDDTYCGVRYGTTLCPPAVVRISKRPLTTSACSKPRRGIALSLSCHT